MQCPVSCGKRMQAVPGGWRNWWSWLAPTLAWQKSNRTHLEHYVLLPPMLPGWPSDCLGAHMCWVPDLVVKHVYRKGIWGRTPINLSIYPSLFRKWTIDQLLLQWNRALIYKEVQSSDEQTHICMQSCFCRVSISGSFAFIVSNIDARRDIAEPLKDVSCTTWKHKCGRLSASSRKETEWKWTNLLQYMIF